VVTVAPPSVAKVSPWRRRAWTVTKLVVFVGLAALVVQVALSHRDELSGAGTYLEDLSWVWVGVAVIAESLSMLCFTALQGRLLRSGGLSISMGSLLVITLAGNAMANSLPAGGAFASVFAYRQFRRKGADEALATWTLVAVTGLTAVTLAGIAIVGLGIAGGEGPVDGIVPLVGLLLLGPAAGIAVLLRPQFLGVVMTPPLRLGRRLTGRPREPAEVVITRAVERLQAVTPKVPDWIAALGWAAGNWAADCTCLVAAFMAVHAPVPARALLLAYGAAQIATNLPITPGGLGVVEGSLTVALVAFGGSTSATVAAVLLYRLMSFWVLLPVGWLAWSGLWVQARRALLRGERQ
jgi:uncharacterized membrane protein YbhN (UPF0104 family)